MSRFYLFAVLAIYLISAVQATTESQRGSDVQVVDNKRWQTPPEIVNEVLKQNGIFPSTPKSWTHEDCEVVIMEMKAGNFMHWKKGNDVVILIQKVNDKDTQNFKFEPSVDILVSTSGDTVIESWRSKQTEMKFYLEKGSKKAFQWKGTKDIEFLKKYQAVVSSWCAVNKAWVVLPCDTYKSNPLETDF